MTEQEPSSNSLHWDIDQTHPQQRLLLRAAFQQVLDPELGLSIVQLGLVRNVQINDGTLVISMIMTTPFCPYAPVLIDSTKAAAEAVSDLPVVMALGMEPWDRSMMEDPETFNWGLF